MRVALIPTPELSSEWGSTLHAKLLIDQLAGAGIDIAVYCRSLPAEPTPGVCYRVLPLPVSHPVLVEEQIPDRDLMAFTSLVTGAVLEDHTERSFDLVHAHYATIPALAGLWIKTLCGPALVVSSFGRDLHVGAVRDARYRRMVALTVPAADALIASDAGVARELVADYGAAPERVHEIPMSLDDRLFSKRAREGGKLRSRLLGRADHLVVNVSSCFGAEKGLTQLLRATRIVMDRGLRPSLVIIGADDHEDRRCEKVLRSVADELGIGSVVNFVGRIAHREIPDYLAAADVVVDPRVVGNFSSVVLEALFTGACVLASDVPGSRPWLEGTEHGMLHRAGDVEDLSRKLEEILRDGNLRSRLRRSVEGWPSTGGRVFTARYMRDETLNVYRRALRSRLEL